MIGEGDAVYGEKKIKFKKEEEFHLAEKEK